jgi:transcriptional regulator with PAS, ATPase and Fis domain
MIRAADLHLPAVAVPLLPGTQVLAEVERTHIRTLLDAHSGHRNRVASALGITELTPYRKLKRYGLS